MTILAFLGFLELSIADILDMVLDVGVLALIVIFQPEIRLLF